MGNLMGSFFGNTANKSADETMAATAINGANTSATAYLAATLDSTTPEVRRLFSEYCMQSITGQEVLVGLAIKKGWNSPYDTPVSQLESSVQQSQSVLSEQ